MVSTTQKCPPIAPKRGWILVSLITPTAKTLASGLVLPAAVAEHVKKARVVALGKHPLDFRTGVEHPWDYNKGDVLVLNEMAPVAALPFEWDGGKLAVINEAHIAGLWVGEDE